MELTGQRTIPAPIGVTWQALNDPAILKACIPGCESLDRTGADALTAVLALRIGPVSARFKGKVKLDAVQAPTRYAIAFEGQGGMAGFGKGTADVTLTEQGTSTRLDYMARAQVGGRLAQVGSRLVDAAAQKLAEDFFSAFEKNVRPAALDQHVVPAPPVQAPPTARAMPVWVKIGLVVAACLALIVLAFGPRSAHAQGAGWPNRPVRLVVPYAPGGGTDIVARLVAKKLGESVGQTVIVDNRPGGRTVIGYEAVLQEKADGHTLLFNNSSHNIQAAYKGLRYDPASDLTPVSPVAVAPIVFVVTPDNPARTFGEFVAWTRQRPGKVSFGSFGVGTGSHLAGEILNGAEKIDMTHVAYKGSAPALNDLLGGQVQALFVDPASAVGYVKAGRLRALAITGSHRWKAYADVPTFGELGYKDLASDGWWGVLVKKGTPPEIVDRLATELKKIAQTPEFGEKVETLGAEPSMSTPREFDRWIRSDMARWKRVVEERNISLE